MRCRRYGGRVAPFQNRNRDLPPWGTFSNSDYAEARVKSPDIEGIACDYCVAYPLRADYDVSVGNVRRPTLSQQRSHRLGVDRVKGHHGSLVVLHQPPQTHLLGRVADDLSKSSGGDNNSTVAIQSHPHNGKHPAIISLQRDEAARIERDTGQAAFPGVVFFVLRLCGDSIFLAHARSPGFKGPPVSIKPWSIMSLNSAEF